MEHYNEEKFNEIKERVIENKQTRDDVLTLVEMVESVGEAIEEAEEYALEEVELNEMVFDDKGLVL